MSLQQQQQQPAHRPNSRACDRFLIATPTPSTNSDYSSDAGEGHVRRVSVDVDSFLRTKNPDQTTKKRSRSMDAETVIKGFSQLYIASTLSTAPIDTTTTKTATGATTKTTYTADNKGIDGTGGSIHSQDYHCMDYHRYCPPGWAPISTTLTFAPPIATPTAETTPVSTAPRRGRPRNSNNNNSKNNNNGPRPSWPPARHYYSHHLVP
ncbi:hypothetical protein BGZ95_005268 [Linnemannia exigua]|uniref:Uncharacterized protein n=1 Tax=Linnemannia exigua TaxID=604196 RepID=A0AAD4DH98_9FUNG|nr:hypothetical protein BGZ95_005268 [Linnemannia exigua]